MNETFKLVGVIEDKTIKEGVNPKGMKYTRCTFQIDGKKFGSFDETFISTFKIGDRVAVEYTKSGLFNNITSMRIDHSNGEVAKSTNDFHLLSSPLQKDKLIVRQSCLKCACDVWFEAKGDKSILQMAEEFEAWVWRE